jgi:YidC/Oxa1 family membrane protein insertase
MKKIRYLLYGALVVVCLILWNTWQKESPIPTIQKATQEQTQTATKEGYLSQKEETTPKEEFSKRETNLQKGTKISGRIIHVKTDVLNVNIDTLGGKITRATLEKYPETLHGKTPFILLNGEEETLYISQSGMLSSKERGKTPLQYKAEGKDFVLKKGDDLLKVVLVGKRKDGITVTETFIFKPNKYDINITYLIKNNEGKEWTGKHYMQLTRKASQAAKKGTFSLRSFFGVAVSSADSPYQKYKFPKLKKKPLDESIQGGWLAMVQHYFLSAWVPDPSKEYNYYSQAGEGEVFVVGMVGPKIKIAPGDSIKIDSNFYAGPKIAKRLDSLSPHLAQTIDYGFLWIIAILLFKAMKFFYNLIGNWGWAIIIVTALIKLVFYKLSETSYKSMAGMRKLQPKIAQLKERFGGDKQGFSKAMMEVYKKEKINPLGGCLPIVIQIPVFFALYWVLLESVELRQAPFIFWIHDLSAKDPYYILPILMGISMYLQQKLSPAPADPTQAKVMMFLPVIMTVFFLNFPAGLVLYWFVNNMLSVSQQWYVTKKFEHGGYKKKKVKDKNKNKKKRPFWWPPSSRG